VKIAAATWVGTSTLFDGPAPTKCEVACLCALAHARRRVRYELWSYRERRCASSFAQLKAQGWAGHAGECLSNRVTGALYDRVMGDKVALITDRAISSGGTAGSAIGHVGPEAPSRSDRPAGKNGDIITIDREKGTLDVNVLMLRFRDAPRPSGRPSRPTTQVRHHLEIQPRTVGLMRAMVQQTASGVQRRKRHVYADL